MVLRRFANSRFTTQYYNRQLLWSLSLDSQHHPAIYWAKLMLWEHSSLQDICDFCNDKPF